jgi:hypothetical protein
MKRSAFILGAIAAITLAGCEMGGNNGYTQSRYFPTKMTETTAGVTVTTTYKWDDNANQIEETQTTSGSSVGYVISDYENAIENNIHVSTCIRVSTDAEGVQKTETLKSTYGAYAGGGYRESKFEIFESGSTTPVEVRETKYGNDGISDYKITRDGVVTLHRNEYNYNVSSLTGFTFKESVNGGEPVNICHVYTEVQRDYNGDISAVLGYEIYSNWTGNKENSTLIEKKTDYSESGTTSEYTITKYDANGENPVVTEVETDYKLITVTYE